MATKSEAPITPIPSSTIINFAGEIAYVKTILESIREDINELKERDHPKSCLHGQDHGSDVHTTKQKVSDLSKMFYVMITILIAVLGSAIGYVVKSTEANASMSSNINTIRVDVDAHTKILSRIINERESYEVKVTPNRTDITTTPVIDMPISEIAPFAKIKRHRSNSGKKIIMRDGGL